MKILVTGATGLIGKRLITKLQSKGHEVVFLTTAKSKIDDLKGCVGYYWNPLKGEIDVECLKDVQIIYNLAGSSINGSWSKEGKELIVKSRTNASDTLYQLLKNNIHKVSQVICASAIGIYGTLDHTQDENNFKIANNFLGKVVQEWEAYNLKFEDLGVRTTILRIGLVLDREGGALAELEKIARKGMLSVLASGQQYYSWIHIDDLIDIFLFVAERKLSGIFNAVAPRPETNREFTVELSKAMKRRIHLPKVPFCLLSIVLGEKVFLVAKGQLISCSKLLKEDFVFQYPTLDRAFGQLFLE